MIKITDIPYDLIDILDEDEIICGTYSSIFDEEMLKLKLFEYGTLRRSHRIITEKAKKLTFYKIVGLLVGKTVKEVKEYYKLENKRKDLQQMFNLAKKYNYKVLKND